MKFISITKSINILPDWASIGAVLKAGTPLDITGAVANSSAAVGILADDAEKSSAEVAVVTEGSIDLAEITASYGELEDDCIAAIKGISFIGSDGNPIVPSGGGGGSDLPDVTAADNGKVLGVVDGAWAPDSKGYSYEPEILVPQQTVTANDMGGMYVAMLNDCVILSKRFDKAKVTLDGIEYEIDKTQIGFSPLFGKPPQNGVFLGDGTQMSPDLSNLPFFILVTPDGSGMYVTTSGEHTIKAEALMISADDAFTEAVKSAGIWLDVVYDIDAGEVRCTNQLTGETISPKDALIMIGNHDYKNISYNGNPAFVAYASTSIDFVWASLSGNSVTWTGTSLAANLFT